MILNTVFGNHSFSIKQIQNIEINRLNLIVNIKYPTTTISTSKSNTNFILLTKMDARAKI